MPAKVQHVVFFFMFKNDSKGFVYYNTTASEKFYFICTGEKVQQPEQLKEQGQQADEVMKVNHEQLQLAIKEIEMEMESLGNTFTFESSTPEGRDILAKIQVH